MSPWKRAEQNLNPHHPRMLCAKFGWNWSNGSGEKKYHPFCMSKCKYVLHVFHFENFSSPVLIFVTHWAFFIVIFFSVLWDWGQGPKNLKKFGYNQRYHLKISWNIPFKQIIIWSKRTLIIKAKFKNLCSMHWVCLLRWYGTPCNFFKDDRILKKWSQPRF